MDREISSPRAAYEAKRWKLWKFALGGLLITGVGFTLNRAEEAEYYRYMEFNDLEIAIQIAAHIGAGPLVGLLVAALENVWAWHSTGNHDAGRPHFVLAVVCATFAFYMLATLNPYYR